MADKDNDAWNATRRILIVDDDRDLAESLHDTLESKGYIVETAHDAKTAQALAGKFNAQVALLDIRLGRANGVGLISKLKQQHPEIICVMMTAYRSAETVLKALRQGAYDYLTKPLHPDELLATLERCYEKLHLEQERQRAEKETAALLEENRLLAQRSIAVQEEERRSLAGEFHDELGQCLTAVQADAETISMLSKDTHPKIHESAQAIVTVSREIYDVVRRIMQRLRPTLLDELGLLEALEEHIAQWHARYPTITCELAVAGELDHLGEAINITVYRIVQECLTNVAKHAHASHVDIALRRRPDKASNSEVLELVVKDNGKGMGAKTMHRGLGLLGMRERTLAVGGEFAIDSAPYQGMCTSARIPLARPRETTGDSINAD